MRSFFSGLRVHHFVIAALAVATLSLVHRYLGFFTVIRPSSIACAITPSSRCLSLVAANLTFAFDRDSYPDGAIHSLVWTDQVLRVREVDAPERRSTNDASLSFALAYRDAFDDAYEGPEKHPCPTQPGDCLSAASHIATRGIWPIETPVDARFRPELNAEETQALGRLLIATLSLVEAPGPQRPSGSEMSPTFYYSWINKILNAVHPLTRAKLPTPVLDRAAEADEAARAAAKVNASSGKELSALTYRLGRLTENKEWAEAHGLAREVLTQFEVTRLRNPGYLECCGEWYLELFEVFLRSGDAETAAKIARALETQGDYVATLHTFEAFEADNWHLKAVLALHRLEREAEARRLLAKVIDGLPEDDGGRAKCSFFGCDDFALARSGALQSAAGTACRLESGEDLARVIELTRTKTERLAVFHGLEGCLADTEPARTPVDIASSVGARPSFEIFGDSITRAVRDGDEERARTVLREALDHGESTGRRPDIYLGLMLRLAVALDERSSIPVIARKLMFVAATRPRDQMASTLADAAVLLAAAERRAGSGL